MELSVQIPTYRRPEKLGACLRALARQTLGPGTYEVLVGFDGPDPEGARAAREAWVGAPAGALRIFEYARQGHLGVRKALLDVAAGRTLVSLNDDVVAAPDFLEVHLREQRAAEARGRPAIIVGDSPWKAYPDGTLFERLLRETSLMFFYDSMHGSGFGPDHDWGFRHCFGLNMSMPMGAVREVGGSVVLPFTYGHEDIELGFKLQKRFGMPVLFRPGAVGVHDHRYTPADVLRREHSLGRASWLFAGLNPEFGAALFGRDVRSEAELAYSREFLQRERATSARIETEFLGLGAVPGTAVRDQHAAPVLRALAQQFTLLKRYVWRQGLLEASEGREPAYRALNGP